MFSMRKIVEFFLNNLYFIINYKFIPTICFITGMYSCDRTQSPNGMATACLSPNGVATTVSRPTNGRQELSLLFF